MHSDNKLDKDVELEREQTRLRLVGLFVWSVYLLYLENKLFISNKDLVIATSIIYLLFSIALKIFADHDAGKKNIRWYLGIFIDIPLTTILMYLLMENGPPLFSIYLWVTIGNGFRYGSKYLIISAILSIICFTMLSHLNPFWNEAGQFVFSGYVILIIVPLYVEILLRRVNQEKERAKAASREKTRFLANISHEIRTPLNAIVGFSSMLGKADDVDQQQQMVRYINDASASLMSLVEGVLDFSRIESGRIVIRKSRMDLHTLLTSVEGMFSIQAERKQVKYSTRISDAVPALVLGDMQRLRQILVNLVGNAVKFTDKGEIEVTVDVVVGDGGKKMIRFDVLDTGEGIREMDQARIFERFRQVDESAQRQYGGAGLGTAIAKGLVELMGGEIGLESVYGRGSRFWFTVPLEEYELQAGETDPAHEVPDSASSGRIPPSTRVLVAEDSHINRIVYQKMFGHLGGAVTFAETGAEALQHLRDERFDLLILDMQMPGMSGLDVLNRYRETTPPENRVPVAVITGDATADIRQECERLGVSSFLAKPVGLAKLRSLVNNHATGIEAGLAS